MGALWKIFKEALDLPKGEQYDDSALMDISPPEFENWEETERKRKRLPLKYQPEDDDNLMFFEKGLHQDVNRPESERSLTPYGNLKLGWQIHNEINIGDKVKLIASPAQLQQIRLNSNDYIKDTIYTVIDIVRGAEENWGPYTDNEFVLLRELPMGGGWWVPYHHWQEFLGVVSHKDGNLQTQSWRVQVLPDSSAEILKDKTWADAGYIKQTQSWIDQALQKSIPYQKYINWVIEHGHITPSAGSVFNAYVYDYKADLTIEEIKQALDDLWKHDEDSKEYIINSARRLGVKEASLEVNSWQIQRETPESGDEVEIIDDSFIRDNIANPWTGAKGRIDEVMRYSIFMGARETNTKGVVKIQLKNDPYTVGAPLTNWEKYFKITRKRLEPYPKRSNKLAWQNDLFEEDAEGVFWYNPRNRKEVEKFYKNLRKNEERYEKSRKRRQRLLEKELPNILKNITYRELPDYVRNYFEQEFQHVFKQVPEAYQYVSSLTIDMRLHHGKYGDWAEYFKDDNRIEFYKEWHWDSLISQLVQNEGIDNPEEIRKYFINKYLNRTIIHELTHSLQNYFDKIGTQHHFVAPYPQEEHPDYYKHKDFYKQDPGEIQAYDVGDSFAYPKDVHDQRKKDLGYGFNKYYSLKFADPLTYTDKSDVSDGEPFKDRALMFHTEEATDIDNPTDNMWIEQEPNFFPAPSNENEIAQLDRDDNTILNNENKRKKTLTWQITPPNVFEPGDVIYLTKDYKAEDGSTFFEGYEGIVQDDNGQIATVEFTDDEAAPGFDYINTYKVPSNILKNVNDIVTSKLAWKLPTSLAIPRYIWADMNALKENLSEWLFEPGGSTDHKVMMLRSTWDNTSVSKSMIGRLEEVFLRKGRNELQLLLYDVLEGLEFFDSNYQELATDTTLWEAAIKRSEKASKALKTITDSTVPGGQFDLESSLKFSWKIRPDVFTFEEIASVIGPNQCWKLNSHPTEYFQTYEDAYVVTDNEDEEGIIRVYHGAYSKHVDSAAIADTVRRFPGVVGALNENYGPYTLVRGELKTSSKIASDDPSFDDYDNRDTTRRRNDFFKYDTDKPGGEDSLDMQDRYYEDLMYKKDTEKEYKERNALDWTGRENLQVGFGSLKLGWLARQHMQLNVSVKGWKGSEVSDYVKKFGEVLFSFGIHTYWHINVDLGEVTEEDILRIKEDLITYIRSLKIRKQNYEIAIKPFEEKGKENDNNVLSSLKLGWQLPLDFKIGDRVKVEHPDGYVIIDLISEDPIDEPDRGLTGQVIESANPYWDKYQMFYLPKKSKWPVTKIASLKLGWKIYTEPKFMKEYRFYITYLEWQQHFLGDYVPDTDAATIVQLNDEAIAADDAWTDFVSYCWDQVDQEILMNKLPAEIGEPDLQDADDEGKTCDIEVTADADTHSLLHKLLLEHDNMWFKSSHNVESSQKLSWNTFLSRIGDVKEGDIIIDDGNDKYRIKKIDYDRKMVLLEEGFPSGNFNGPFWVNEQDMQEHGFEKVSWKLVDDDLKEGDHVTLIASTEKLEKINLSLSLFERRKRGRVADIYDANLTPDDWPPPYNTPTRMRVSFRGAGGIVWNFPYELWRDFFVKGWGSSDVTSSLQKESWGRNRRIWISYWAVPPNQRMNTDNQQVNWTVVTVIYDVTDYKQVIDVIKTRLRDYVKINYPGTFEDGYFWGHAYMWALNSENNENLDKFYTKEEIEKLKDNNIAIVDIKPFPVEVRNQLESL